MPLSRRIRFQAATATLGLSCVIGANDFHWNARGHALAATLILPALETLILDVNKSELAAN